MAAPLETVVRQLEDSGIVAAGKLENFVPPKAHPRNVEELVAELVRQNHLTPFQAQQVKLGKAKALVLGAYTILDKIGAGGMGQVFKAQHRRMERVVAIKMLPPAMMKDAAAAARFQREVVAAAKLRHPNIVAADDAAEANGVHFLVMEYVEGKDLSALVKKDGPLPVGKAVNYILQAARGLEFAHGEGVVHRDIKPANLLLDKKGVVKILDMGLARIEAAGNAAAQAELTSTGAVMGTVDYMAPEQALSTKNADQRADIYSLGIALYYLIAGRAAYGGDSIMEKLLAHREQPIPSLQDAQITVPKPLEAVFKTMVAKRVEERYQSMSEVVEALESLGIGGSGATGSKSDIASVLSFSAEDRKKLSSKAKKKPLESLTGAIASEKTKYLIAKIAGGAFATIIAPIMVVYLVEYLKKDHSAPSPPAVTTPAATVAANTTSPSSAPVVAGDGRPNRPWNTPAFQAWVKTVAAMPAEKQIEAVSKKLVELNPGFDGKLVGANANPTPKIENGVVTQLGFLTLDISDISPLRALAGLKALSCGGSAPRFGKLSDLSPLEGMQLTFLYCGLTQVQDLTPLEGMPLKTLYCTSSQVSDLSPIQGLPLTVLICSNCNGIVGLSPIAGMRLTGLEINGTSVSDLSPLRDCTSLATLNLDSSEVTAEGVAALQKALPNCSIKWNGAAKAVVGQPNRPWNSPTFQAWVKATQTLPAEQQVEAVSKKLMDLNPGFDGKLTGSFGSQGTPAIQNGVVTQVGFATGTVTDISPVRAFSGLKTLACTGESRLAGKLSDLSPLKGMHLTSLACSITQVSDLTPLNEMPLTSLTCHVTGVADLSPIQGAPLTELNISNTPVSDLSPLKGMKLISLHCGTTKITDISILSGMPLTTVYGIGPRVSNFSPLEECKSLKMLNLRQTKVTAAQIAALQRALPNCKIVWDRPAEAP